MKGCGKTLAVLGLWKGAASRGCGKTCESASRFWKCGRWRPRPCGVAVERKYERGRSRLHCYL